MSKPLLSALSGAALSPPPVWMMRQAGRYLAEYREVRQQAGSFLNLCFNPAMAAEVTLQPIRRFGFDAAILFSDILVIPHALGQTVRFVEGEGPRLDPISDGKGLSRLAAQADGAILAPVYETVSRVKAELPPQVTLIGFCGAPWTVATYMVAGRGTPDQGPAKKLAKEDPQAFAALIDKIVEASTGYLIGQIDAGAECVQIFDSWAGSLSGDDFDRWCIAANKKLIDKIRAARPNTPIIGFPRGAGRNIPRYVEATGVNGVSLETEIDRKFARDEIQSKVTVQGNLDPEILREGGDALDRAVDEVMQAFSGKPFIFNLGHGILPDTPVVHVERMLKRVRG